MDGITALVAIVVTVLVCITVMVVRALPKPKREQDLEKMLMEANVQLAEYRRKELVGGLTSVKVP